MAATIAAAPSASAPTLVYPGKLAEPQRTVWKGKWTRITEYAQLPDLLSEWEGGVQYACGGKKTPPFKTLEQDMAEGHQCVAWRNVDCKPLHAKKLFIYTLLSAEQPREFVVALQAEAEILGRKQKGKPPSLYSHAMAVLDKDHSSLIVRKPAPFEKEVLKWNRSQQYTAQAQLSKE
ncbi:hypothetical protein WJX74_002516 [Apatococcus lobatus]|uniref:Uncharacterized protein n=1 Tax=Apatococcus lobatus TaxID=904363 RepID=A0AAW1RIZ1_9CHLO